MAERVDVSLMALTVLTKKQRRLNLWLVWWKRPRKVGDVEDIWLTERRVGFPKRLAGLF